MDIPKDFHILPHGSMIIKSDKVLTRTIVCEKGGRVFFKCGDIPSHLPGTYRNDADYLIIRMSDELLRLRLKLLTLQLKLEERGIKY